MHWFQRNAWWALVGFAALSTVVGSNRKFLRDGAFV